MRSDKELDKKSNKASAGKAKYERQQSSLQQREKIRGKKWKIIVLYIIVQISEINDTLLVLLPYSVLPL